MGTINNKRINYAYENAKASLEIEGYKAKQEDKELITAYLKKEISFDTFVEIAKKRAKTTGVHIFKIAHFYSTNHDKTSFFIKTNIDTETLGEIIACIQFRFEELVNESLCINDEHLLSILKEYFGVEDVTKEYQKYLPYTQLVQHEWSAVNVFYVPDPILVITQIDQYHMRESCCGPNYKDLMDKRLPGNEDFDKAIINPKYGYAY